MSTQTDQLPHATGHLSWRLAFRMLRRDWRAGELRVLLFAIVVAVACVTSVGFFTDRIQQALSYQSGELLAADLRVVADHPLPEVLSKQLVGNSLRTAETRSFRSMVQSKAETEKLQSRLAEIKAVSSAYPLRGKLKIAPARFAPEQVTSSLPLSGEVWVDAQLLQQLNLHVGEQLQIGYSRFRISAVLTYEPDRSGDMFSIAPRVLMNLADLSATGLEQEGSHIHYRLLLAGETQVLTKLRKTLQARLQRGERIEGVEDARPEIRTAMQRAQQFLGLAAVVAVMLACVAIALAARRYAQRHLDTCAMLRCFGASQGQINQLFFWQLVLLSLIAGSIGVLCGYLAQAALVELLGSLLVGELPAPSLMPVVIGLLVAFGGILGFALPPVLQLREVPALRVLRRGLALPNTMLGRQSAAAYLTGFALLSLLVVYQAGDLVLGGILLAGLLLALVLFWLAARGLILLLKTYTQGSVPGLLRRSVSSWHLGLVNLTRNVRMSTIQVMAFGLGLMVLLLLTVVRGDLLQGWAQGLAEDAPNRFVINIQSQQLSEVEAFFAHNSMSRVELFPMVRGRLMAINDRPVSEEQYTNPRAKRLAMREFNLSWADQLQAGNNIVQGQWWNAERTNENTSPAAFSREEFSVEEGIANTLGIALGDRLTYLIAGEEVTAPVTSLRSVQWDSFQANFFVLAPPGALDAFPASYITSFYLPAEKAALLDQLVQRFPNLTIIDIAAILNQVRLIIERVSLAVEFVFLFTLAAGFLVMAAAIQSTLDVRLHENAVLRALGARRRRLWQSLSVEFVALGSLAGLLGAFFAALLGWVIAQQVLEMDYLFNPLFNPGLWLVGLLGGGLGVGLAGIIGTRQVVNSPPLAVLRKL